jgi:zinc transport system substrate-binding protein
MRLRLILLLQIMMISSCFAGNAKKTDVIVSIPPQAYVVEQIGNGYVSVHTLISPGQSPHTYEPTPRQMAEIAGAALYFTVDFPFEQKLVSKIRDSNSKLEIVDMAEGIKRRMLEGDEGHAPSHAEPDPHVWLSPFNLKIMAENTARTLGTLDPEHDSIYRSNLHVFLDKLEKINQKIKQLLEPHHGDVIIVYHPAFGYFTDYYGLRQVAIEMEGKSPTPREIEMLITLAKEDDVHIIFAQPEFDPRSAEAVARAINGTVVPLDPLAENVMMNLQKIADKIAESLK